jgi:hypothetical protein
MFTLPHGFEVDGCGGCSGWYFYPTPNDDSTYLIVTDASTDESFMNEGKAPTAESTCVRLTVYCDGVEASDDFINSDFQLTEWIGEILSSTDWVYGIAEGAYCPVPKPAGWD